MGRRFGACHLPQFHPMDMMAAPALSWSLRLLVLLLPLAAPGTSAAVNDAPQLTCFYNSKANISCVWSQDGDLPGTACHIRAQSNQRSWNKTCELLPRQASWACSLILGSPDSQGQTSADVLNLSVMCREGERWRVVATQDFKPFKNLRLMAPDSLRVTHIGTHQCNITWSTSQVSHYIERELEFEARTRSPGHSWEEATLLTLRQRQQWIHLEMLVPDTQYELQVRVRPQRHQQWSPWSRPLAFRTRPAASATAGEAAFSCTSSVKWMPGPKVGLHAEGLQCPHQPGPRVPGKEAWPLPWFVPIIGGLSGTFGFVVLVYLLASCRYIRPWLKKALKCHIPDPSEFFSQLSSEHGGDFQKWLSSPFPSSSFTSGALAPEISPLEVLEKDAKAAQLLLLQQDRACLPSPDSHSLASCFTNQGYFFFHLPDALEIESCQVYFTYDPCAEEEPEDGGPGAPPGPPPAPILPLSGEDAYCTFPPGEDLLLFSPSLPSGLNPPHTALTGSGAMQAGVPGDCALQPPTPGPPDLEDFQSPLELAVGEVGEEVPALGPGEPSPTRQGQSGALTSLLALNTDAYLSLQELQDQDPAHSV
ncbi:Interleukin-2 receptor subunit beta [Tupaia chinensis]|uniref:Interleukin-2 receptor subunit beta n=1 Tax=Tupaia chinensis TaxID=246437 RepID=L9JPD7_TUPCH|nr:Interleukin-2 receptor subunit beta [Tupaia chinensis]